LARARQEFNISFFFWRLGPHSSLRPAFGWAPSSAVAGQLCFLAAGDDRGAGVPSVLIPETTQN